MFLKNLTRISCQSAKAMEHLSIIYIIELYQNQMSGHKTRQVVLRLLPLTFSCRVPDSKVPGPREPIPPTLLLLARCCHRSRTSETWTCGLKRTTVNLTLGRKEITIKIRMKRRRIFCTSAQCETNIVWIAGKIITPFKKRKQPAFQCGKIPVWNIAI